MVPRKSRRACTIAFAATKGGVGKTTLAAALAARVAAHEQVVLIDLDPQLSLSRWHELRGFPENPNVIGRDTTRETLARAHGADWLFLDTPPALLERSDQAIAVADFVLIPSKPSAVDLEAVRDTLGLCRRHHKPFAFVLNQVLRPPGLLTQQSRKYLEEDGPVLTAQVLVRKPYVAAMTVGKTGPEQRDGKEAAEEIDALWAELKAAVVKHER